ncbi:hypothetical protein Tco_1090384 [Tanacetum coccineum]|uniref:Uncharacterized protein n=1 Tax=Tanacetum coccineum TaxID=301880 RepID=A0ABQ5I4B0_9ASTR
MDWSYHHSPRPLLKRILFPNSLPLVFQLGWWGAPEQMTSNGTAASSATSTNSLNKNRLLLLLRMIVELLNALLRIYAEIKFGENYRTNYFLMILFILGKEMIFVVVQLLDLFLKLLLTVMIMNLLCVGLGFLRRPLAIVAALSTALTIAFLNDSFAGTFSEKVTRTVRQFSPHLAAKMRPPQSRPVLRGRPSSKSEFLSLVCFLRPLDLIMGTYRWPSWLGRDTKLVMKIHLTVYLMPELPTDTAVAE